MKALVLLLVFSVRAPAVELETVLKEAVLSPLAAPAAPADLMPRPTTIAPIPLESVVGTHARNPETAVPALAVSAVMTSSSLHQTPAASRQARNASTRSQQTAQGTAEELVRGLVSGERAQDIGLAATFDGAKVHDVVFIGASAVGETRETRHGAFTLAFSEVEDKDGTVVLLERWTGPNGGMWVKRTRGRWTYGISEWRGPDAPAPFGGAPRAASSKADFWLGSGNEMTSNIETAGNRSRSTFVNAKKEFAAALAWFGDQARAIKGFWINGDNLAEFNRLTATGLSPEQAAAQTWTGQRAAERGFTRVAFPYEGQVLLRRYPPGNYRDMSVLFLKP